MPGSGEDAGLIDQAVLRWQELDELLPGPGAPPHSCGVRLTVDGPRGKPQAAGCEHWEGQPDSLDLTWGAAIPADHLDSRVGRVRRPRHAAVAMAHASGRAALRIPSRSQCPRPRRSLHAQAWLAGSARFSLQRWVTPPLMLLSCPVWARVPCGRLRPRGRGAKGHQPDDNAGFRLPQVRAPIKGCAGNVGGRQSDGEAGDRADQPRPPAGADHELSCATSNDAGHASVKVPTERASGSETIAAVPYLSASFQIRFLAKCLKPDFAALIVCLWFTCPVRRQKPQPN
jgi:hypothetical protein